MSGPPQYNPALLLPGGGARGAYQVGVVKAVLETLGADGNPFPIIVGTSAGAINAGVLASHAHEFAYGLQRLEYFWRTMTPDRIYRTDWPCVIKNGLHWLAAMLLGRLGVPAPRALLDTSPLRRLLEHEMDLSGVTEAIDAGALRAFAVTASGFTCAKAVTAFQAVDGTPWERSRRLGRSEEITISHLIASAALPLLFPAIRVGNEYFGDGGLRQTAPLSPAIHLGADRILVVTTRDEHPDPEPTEVPEYPSIGDIGGYMLDVLFMDNLQADISRLQRINRTLSLMDERSRSRSELRPIDALVIRPSRDVRTITAEYMDRVPASVKTLLAGIGAWRKGTRLPSYLLFDQAYCSALIELGYQDALNQADEIRSFLG